mmetsp:Transcript_11595/g.22822  ORF Transcript_11595/g.22822 Transcript_11595/m.22822 type:complete len:84 (-) Transcript_11595:534-785(-)
MHREISCSRINVHLNVGTSARWTNNAFALEQQQLVEHATRRMLVGVDGQFREIQMETQSSGEHSNDKKKKRVGVSTVPNPTFD